MRTKLITFRKSLALINISPRNYASKSGDRAPPHMNDLPIPRIPWDEYNADRQRFYNMHLVGGAVCLIISIGVVLYTKSMYMNFSPPKYPAPPSDMVEECDDGDAD